VLYGVSYYIGHCVVSDTPDVSRVDCALLFRLSLYSLLFGITNLAAGPCRVLAEAPGSIPHPL
jgi:hypothetical protein